MKRSLKSLIHVLSVGSLSTIFVAASCSSKETAENNQMVLFIRKLQKDKLLTALEANKLVSQIKESNKEDTDKQKKVLNEVKEFLRKAKLHAINDRIPSVSKLIKDINEAKSKEENKTKLTDEKVNKWIKDLSTDDELSKTKTKAEIIELINRVKKEFEDALK